MSTHKHSEAGNELRSLSMIRYDQSMNATTQRSKDSHFWHLTPLPAHRQVHTSHTPTSGLERSPQGLLLNCQSTGPGAETELTPRHRAWVRCCLFAQVTCRVWALLW